MHHFMRGSRHPALFAKARVQKKVKKKRAGGSDTLSVEFVLVLLSIPEGSTFILSLVNQCWRTETIPELWQLGRISAI